MIYAPEFVKGQFNDILDACAFQLSDLKPSKWAKKHMHIKEGNFPGPLRFDKTPQVVEILDRLSPYSGFTEVAVMGARQFGKTKSIVEPIICYYISEYPCNIGFIQGNTDHMEGSMIELGKAIENAGISDLIRSSVKKKRNSRTGDTRKHKEFAGGAIYGLSASHHPSFRRINLKLVIADDIAEAVKFTQKSGSTIEQIRGRASSYGDSKKIFWCSSPLYGDLASTETDRDDIIVEVFKEGDQREWCIPCQNPNCGAMIDLQFEIKIPGTDEKAGIWWKLDEHTGKLDRKSVEYICQVCGHGFNEKNKYEFNKAGIWEPRAVSSSPDKTSYHISYLNAMPGADSWAHIVERYMKAKPANGFVDETRLKTFYNLDLGLPYIEEGVNLKASNISNNSGRYEIGIVPEAQSIKDGNGRIIYIAVGSDLNGWEKAPDGKDDVRLDWSMRAFGENGASYGIAHGSIGTWQRGGANDQNREKWSCDLQHPRCVWNVFDEIIGKALKSDAITHDGRMKAFWVNRAGVDTGAFRDYVFAYLDSTKHNLNVGDQKIVGLKGHKRDDEVIPELNSKYYAKGNKKINEYFLQVGIFKDECSGRLRLQWNSELGLPQPADFVNFPKPANGLYGQENYFSHFESEERKEKKPGKFVWEKKNSAVQNHMWDCFIYEFALLNIAINEMNQTLTRMNYTEKEDIFTVKDFADLICQRRYLKPLRK